jgi:beta-glucosidase
MKASRLNIVIFCIASGIAVFSLSSCESTGTMGDEEKEITRKIDSVLSMMTLEEKVGQLMQITGFGEFTGPVSDDHNYLDPLKNGRIGSMLNVNGAAYTRKLQQVAVEETRLGIPLIFGYDVIHGYRTIFPVPLAETASWDMELIETSARIAATEAAAAGQHWTFAPMVDIARDPRWGRIMEGAGEDPYLGSLVAAARVKGFQGNDLTAPNTIVACAKHFAAYGAAMAGKDYNTVDISSHTLHEIYLPPFKAAVDAGVETFMSSFNEINGVPATANRYILTDLLKKEWQFRGFIVSDWSSIRELIPHGVAKNDYEAGYLAMNAGVDMDMMGLIYDPQLFQLLDEGKVTQTRLDDAVRRILRVKFKLGLFDDPYRYCNEEREREVILSEEHLEIARDVARKSIVLLKNENNLLPLNPDRVNTIALVGPMADTQFDLIGEWSARGNPEEAASLLVGLTSSLEGKTKIIHARGCNITGEDKNGFPEAIRAARAADVVIAAVGESKFMSGEALCRSDIGLPGVQKELLIELQKTGKPIVVVLMNGRPLAIPWVKENVPAILETWFLGTQAGPAITDVLLGKYNPSGKLPVTFPVSVGQIPIFYSHKNTGRPPIPGIRWNSKYLDIPVEPLFPFGYGLSYTTFEYSELTLSDTTLVPDGELTVEVTVKNTGDVDGEEIIQLYIRDLVGSVTRPVLELKGFSKERIAPGESVTVQFSLTEEDLKFYDINMELTAEPGDFEVFIGPNSADLKKATFRFTE